MVHFVFSCFSLFFFLFVPVLVQAAEPMVQVRLIPDVQQVAPGQPFQVVIEQTIPAGWHTYWKNPGDSGAPTVATWDLPEGGEVGDLMFPTPARVAYGPLMNFGYSDSALFLTRLTPPADFKGDRFTARLHLEWLVCKDLCVPESGDYSLSLPVGAAFTPYPGASGVFARARAAQPRPVDWGATIKAEEGQFILTVRPDSEGEKLLAQARSVALFPEEWGAFLNPAPQEFSPSEARGVFTMRLPRDTRSLSELDGSRAVLAVTPAAGDPVAVSFVLRSSGVAGAAPVPEAAPFSASVSSLGTAILFALFGGVILNLMPCVFPVLFLKVLSLSKLSRAETRHVRLHALAYLCGVVTSFVAVAALLIALERAGAAVGWGFQLQQPAVVAFLALLFCAIAFNLLGWIEFSAPALRLIEGGHRHPVYEAFLTGVLATLVATPCTAPFMGAAMGYALLQDAFTALVVFAALGVGLALPFVLVCFVPFLRRLIPHPGRWMETLRQLLALPMLATALWLLSVLAQQTGLNGLSAFLAGMIFLLLAIGVFRVRVFPLLPARGKGVLAGLFLLLAFGVGALGQSGLTRQSGSFVSQGHAAYTEAALSRALSGADPVFVNMTAAWCITCKVNEGAVLETQEIQDLFEEHQVHVLMGDWTNFNAQITAFLDRYGRKGVPLYVFYGAPDAGGVRPPPVVLPQILTRDDLHRAVGGQASACTLRC